MGITADLAKFCKVDINDFLNPAEVRALDAAAADPKKRAAAAVLLKNLQTKMEADKAKSMKKMMHDQYHWDL